MVAAGFPRPVSGSPSSCRLEVRPPKPSSQPAYPTQEGDSQAVKADKRRAANARRAIVDEEEARAAGARFRQVIRVAAVSAKTPNNDGEDHFGLKPLRRWSHGWE